MKQTSGILIFNRDDSELSLIGALLHGEDYPVFETSLPLEAIHILQKNSIDVVLANQDIEGMDGQEFKELAEKIRPGVNILLLPSGHKEKVWLRETVSDCALNRKEFAQFIQNHIRNGNRVNGELLRFKDFFFSFADRLLQILEVNNKYFFNNSHFVADLSGKIALKMKLDEKLVDAIRAAALLRDIGKIGVQQQIIAGKGRLEKDDFTVIKSHPLHSVQILKQVNFPWNVESIITHHHEHYDGNGYPQGLKGRQIPLGSRIISIVDSYFAMITDRPYRNAMPREKAIEDILKKAGTQYDPEIVEVFLSIIQDEKYQIGEKKRILVLDRDEAIAALIKLNFSSEDFEVAIAATSSEGIQYLNDKKPFVVIADSETLSLNNFQFYYAVRQDSSADKTPFIIMVPTKEFPKQVTDPLIDFVVKPLDIDELSLKLKSLSREEGLHKPQHHPSVEELKGVAGNIEDFCLADIIQVLNMGLKTAKLILIRDKEKGIIYLKAGKIVYVATGALTGHEAFFDLMRWEKGTFRIFHGHTTDEINVNMDTMTLLLEASKVLDEKKKSIKETGPILRAV